jgi:hypothetical protein
MKTILAGLGTTVIFGVLAIGCGGSGGDDGDSAGADVVAGPGASPAQAIAPGDYVLDNADVGATLTIRTATTSSVSYSLGILGKTGSQHNGELDNRTATHSGATFNDNVDSDCKISLQGVAGGSIQVKQTGSCSDAGFGAFLDGSGTYTKKAASSPTPSPAPSSNGWVGLYETETTHRAWAIRISSESPFKFRLVAGHLEDTSEFVDAKDLVAELNGDSALYENGPDCSITFAKTETGIHITQGGKCAEIGFPETEDLQMGDDSGTDFSKIDESQECFDIRELAVGATKAACANPL